MFQQILEQMALALESRGIPYMLIGGQATLLYGEPRLTRDIDVTLGIGPERWSEILELAEASGWQPLGDKEFVERTLVLPCVERASGIRIDFIFSHSVYEQQAMERVRRVPIGTAKVCFASVEDLIIHKIVAGRPRDLEDVRGVLLKNPDIDLPYVREWLGKFESSLNEKFLERFETLRE